MSEKEKSLVEEIGKLPESVQNEFLAMAKGAAILMEHQAATAEKEADKSG